MTSTNDTHDRGSCAAGRIIAAALAVSTGSASGLQAERLPVDDFRLNDTFETSTRMTSDAGFASLDVLEVDQQRDNLQAYRLFHTFNTTSATQLLTNIFDSEIPENRLLAQFGEVWTVESHPNDLGTALRPGRDFVAILQDIRDTVADPMPPQLTEPLPGPDHRPSPQSNLFTLGRSDHDPLTGQNSFVPATEYLSLGSLIASGMHGQVDADGRMRFTLSVAPDGTDNDPSPAFDGVIGFDPNGQPVSLPDNDYPAFLNLFMDESDVNAAASMVTQTVSGDVDVYTWDDLTPGEEIRVSVRPLGLHTTDRDTPDPLDVFVSLFDSSQNLIEWDTPHSERNLADMVITVPDDGVVTLVVTGRGDNTLAGDHDEIGHYLFNLSREGDFNSADFNGDGVVDQLDIDVILKVATHDQWTERHQLDEFDTDGAVDLDDVLAILDIYYDTRPGDMNLDGRVDVADLSMLARYFGTLPTDLIGQDLNSDGVYDDLDVEIILAEYPLLRNGWSHGNFNLDDNVDLLDLSILASNFGYVSTRPVPAPTPLGLVALTLPLLTRRRRV
ncbi:dockerin type I domain-containing protein [Mucisphaera calidilacus]|uniref:Dockerin domain-containing protein n=1 Tax=Mucisphaera calidilacus TaxID=2527982 RepID=A0A518BYW2_9BACT|nr:dockerin type I domain-containing protein [Mucisphaera calidilacus]QDU72156.1 hypothetical protein Pan265_20190 [Mucisphaera calidilacus]